MFTGIVEEVGEVRSIDRRETLQRTTIDAERVREGLEVGGSVCLSGACHTVVALEGGAFAVESVSETLRRTTLGSLAVGDGVNLERSLRPSDRLDGHLVQGHVDAVGRVARRRQAGESVDLTFELPAALGRYVAEKGSIAVDGVSLTVVSVEDRPGGFSRFSVTIIPHTLAATTLGGLRRGDGVNLEVDVVARYLERLRGGGPPAARGMSVEALRAAGSWTEG